MNLELTNSNLQGKSPFEIIQRAVDNFGDKVVMTSSFGIEAMLMIHLATRVNPNIPIIFLDTGFLFTETYQFALEMISTYRLNVLVYKSPISPDQMLAEYGELWKTDLDRYEHMRKTEPLHRAYRELGIKITLHGIRGYQSDTRKKLDIVVAGPQGTTKTHPILNWSHEDVNEYFRMHNLPITRCLQRGTDQSVTGTQQFQDLAEMVAGRAWIKMNALSTFIVEKLLEVKVFDTNPQPVSPIGGTGFYIVIYCIYDSFNSFSYSISNLCLYIYIWQGSDPR